MRLSACLLLATACLPAAEPALRVLPLEDAAVVRAVDLLRLRIVLVGALVRTGKDGADARSDLELTAIRSRGVWSVSGMGAPGYNKGSHAGTATTGAADGGLVIDLAARIGDDQWVKGDPEARYRITLSTAADGSVSGGFTGRFQGRDITGAITGRASAGGWRGGETATADGYPVRWDLGTRRSGWNTARWAVYELSDSVDMSGDDGLRVRIATPRVRHDTAVDVAVMEEDGSWWHAHSVVPLTRSGSEVLIRFADLRQAEFLFDAEGTRPGVDGNWDEDFTLDTRRVRRIAVGVVDGRGVGEVAFTIRGVERARWLPATAPEPVALTVDGTPMAVNDRREIPEGIFGFHTTTPGAIGTLAELRPGSNRTCVAQAWGSARIDLPAPDKGTRFMVSGIYDRKQQLPQAGSGDWRAGAVKSGQGIGALAKSLGSNAVIEWWNEPYLDLGRMLDGFKQVPWPNDRGIRPGDPVVHNGATLSSMIWIEGRLVKDGKRERKVFDAAAGPIWRSDPKRPERDQGAPTLFAIDPSRFSYWSGRQIGDWYTETLVAAGTELKKVAPEARLVGGFGFRWHEDHWQSWEILHKPMIDAAWQLLDGVCDHRYQGEPQGTLASYEVLAAYTDLRYGKRLKGYNTECNDLWDAPARGGAVDASSQQGFTARRRAIWNLRDILQSVLLVPDKAEARAIHAQWGVDPAKLPPDAKPWQRMGIHEGEYRALHLVRNLRGRMLRTASSDPDVWLAASVDAATGTLVAVAYNDTPQPRRIALRLAAPAGTTLGAGTVDRLWSETDGALRTAQAPATAIVDLELRPTEAVCVQLPITGTLPAGVVRVQRYADVILKPLAPGEQVTAAVKATPATTGAGRTWVRLVLERATAGEGSITINGTRYPIPHTPTIPNTPRIVDIPVDAKAASATEITVTAHGPEAGDGFLVCSASLIGELPAK